MRSIYRKTIYRNDIDTILQNRYSIGITNQRHLNIVDFFTIPILLQLFITKRYDIDIEIT